MNANSQLWIETQLWPWLGDMAWQSTALLAITLVALQCLRYRSATLRHGILVLGIAAVPVLTALSFVMPVWSLRDQSTPAEEPSPPAGFLHVDPANRIAEALPEVPLERSGVSKPSIASPRQAELPTRPGKPVAPPVAVILAILWISGIAGGVAMLALSTLRLHRLRLRAEPVRHPALLAALERARQDAGFSTKAVRLFVTDRGAMPMMWGWRQAIVLLPREAENWTGERLDFVLRHELAHAVRGDAVMSLACWIAMLPIWFHPLAWMVLRALSRLREEACDEHVVAGLHQSQRADYAATLVQVIACAGPGARGGWLPALAMASAHAVALRARLEAIVNEKRDRRPFSRRDRSCALVSVAMLTVALSMFSACRESMKPATGVTRADGSRTYFLTDKQWEALTKPFGSDRQAPSPPSEPFSPAQAAPKAKHERAATQPESLPQFALRIRTHLLEAGVTFTEGPEGEVLVLKDERTMRVWADDTNHDRITKLLGSEEKKPIVRIVCHAFAVPFDAKWLEPLTRISLDEKDAAGGRARLTAALSAEESEMLIRRLLADKTCSLFAAPTLTTPSGQRATVENIREFIYPTEFDPPQVPQNASLPHAAADQDIRSLPITPTTPTAFEMRPVGFRFEVDPAIDVSSRIVDLHLDTEWTVFEGFVNYGTPIYAAGNDAAGRAVPVEVTPNVIKQPMFRTSKLTTSVKMRDGQSVVLGGFGEPSGADVADPQGKIGGPSTYPFGTQGDAQGDLKLAKLPPISKVDRAVFFIFHAKIVD